MVKTFGLVAFAAIAALVLGFGAYAGSGTPTAQADADDVVVIGCELIASSVDGDTTDTTTGDDVAAACGRTNLTTPAYLPAVAAPLAGAASEAGVQCSNGDDDDADGVRNDGCPQSLANLADAIGDEDGTLEKGDFSGELDENYDQNQISTDCTRSDGSNYMLAAVPPFTIEQTDYFNGMACTLDVFVFVDRREPTSIDLPAGAVTIENGLEDFTCTNDFDAADPFVVVVPPTTATIQTDNDCNTAAVPLNSDGVVLFHVVLDPDNVPSIGDTLGARVSQSSAEQDFDINVVGPANNVALSLAEDLIETNGDTSNVNDCTSDTQVTDGVEPPTSTVAWAIATDRDDNELARVPVFFSTGTSEDEEIAQIGVGNAFEEVTSNTFFTIDPTEPTALPTAAYAVVCGGKSTGEVTVDASINLVSCVVTGCTILASEDHDTADLTVGGAPSANVLTAEASTIKCDGTETSTVTATVTDSDGNNVADGVPVNFSVVALGTANPINTETVDGTASSVITPLSNSSAGVTVIVTAGDNGIADVVQTSIRVDCALPLATQPVVAPTPRGGIGGPDTGNGGYLNQDSTSGFPMWTLVALMLGSVTLVAGGLVTRRAGK